MFLCTSSATIDMKPEMLDIYDNGHFYSLFVDEFYFVTSSCSCCITLFAFSALMLLVE